MTIIEIPPKKKLGKLDLSKAYEESQIDGNITRLMVSLINSRKDFLEDGNVDKFFETMRRHGRIVSDYCFTSIVSSADEFITCYNRHNLSPYVLSVEELIRIFRHEKAHKDISQRLGIRAEICITKTADNGLMFTAESSLDDLIRITKGNRVLVAQHYADILLAPHSMGLDYESETREGNEFKEKAREWMSTK